VRLYLLGAGLNGALGVAMGAWASHGLQGRLTPEAIDWVKTGASYQLWHAAALVGLAAVSARYGSRLIAVAGVCFAIGGLLFGGSLHLYAFTQQGWLAMLTPVGGTLLIVAWLAVVASAFRGSARA
jgi:uncharacterized membrane protein YgdD (TMEM256/DUF423 family)